MAGSLLSPSYGTQPSGSSFNPKRKRSSWTSEDHEYEQTKQMRVRSPQLDRRSTFPVHPPDLIADNGHPNSDSDPDQDGDQSMDVDMDMNNGAVEPRVENYDTRDAGYTFSQSGSGGFGFGPGAEEDEEDMETYPRLKLYPSLTAHPNPNHFSNMPTTRPKSPFSALPFSTTLRAPSPRGLLQPTINAPVEEGASEVEKARNSHGPQCKRIPKLVMSPYPDAETGKRSMWTVCEDCGACERAG